MYRQTIVTRMAINDAPPWKAHAPVSIEDTSYEAKVVLKKNSRCCHGPHVNGSYLRYWNQIVAGVRCAKAQYQRESYTRTEQTNFHLVFHIMRQVPCQNVEIEVQRDHCKVPVFTPTVMTAATSVESQLCLPACEPTVWRRQSRGPWCGEINCISERWRSLTGYQWSCSHPLRQSVAPCRQQRWCAPCGACFKREPAVNPLWSITQPRDN